ncbi:MoaD/ThiS family protein [Novosphingobium sp. AP12]|uniref:MoaD/ThiS family protein n=1 Tax=Novosphingobium sp. AP12 TaxID=1144305 RepID=UPI000272007C|nr:MoaD/ThiS family protein [Novosphingobium sp. AP12]EJL24120.1 molybdopterin converting factor, small subunit [Novosphingobium sp. AP12]
MAARLVFLGRLEELAGSGGADFALDAPLDWTALVARLSDEYSPELADLISSDRVKVALNGALVADKQGIMLSNGDEIAFLPPVSGG